MKKKHPVLILVLMKISYLTMILRAGDRSSPFASPAVVPIPIRMMMMMFLKGLQCIEEEVKVITSIEKGVKMKSNGL